MSIQQLSPHVLIEVISRVSYDSRFLGWCRCLSCSMRDALSENSAWTHLCKTYWLATEDRLKEWPSLSPKGLYRTLEHWVPLEGYYSLASAFPWGLPVLLRLAEGRLTVDVIRFIPGADGTLEEVFVNLFVVSFLEDDAGIVQTALASKWQGERSVEISTLDPQLLEAQTSVARVIFDPEIGQTGMLRARRAMRVTPLKTGNMESHHDDGESDESDDDLAIDVRDSPNWEPGERITSRETAVSRTEGMLMEMFGAKSKPCDLALISSPSDFVSQNEDFLGLRPGLYVGDYGHDFYGQYRTEVLLLEYVSLSQDEIRQEIADPSRIFARPGKEKAPKALEELMALGTPIDFICGVKQCGDFHVPMGATTFITVSGPPAACNLMAQAGGAPTSLLNRQTNKQETVVRTWRGFGTLARPGFGGPSWADGWLVQFENSSNGFHRFGFAWDRNQDAVVLQWIVAQDTHPFLQRSWLPGDLQ